MSTVQDAAIALGIGLTNDCDLACPHCYRDPNLLASLSLQEVQAAVSRVPVRSVNLGTGENGLHPDFFAIVDWLSEGQWKMSITSNGFSVKSLDDDRLRKFSSVELSLDFPTRAEQDAWRGAGNWDLIENQAARCVKLGIKITFTAVMMRTNYTRLGEIARAAARQGANFRVNLYQAVQTDDYSLTPEQTWEGYRILFKTTRLVTTTEPILAAALGMEPDEFRGCGCGRSTIRVTPDKRVAPCVYWQFPQRRLSHLLDSGLDILNSPDFAVIRRVPQGCQSCPHLEVCQGGCGGRRMLANAIDEPDPFCPVKWGVHLEVERAATSDLPKAGSACTTIVEAIL